MTVKFIWCERRLKLHSRTARALPCVVLRCAALRSEFSVRTWLHIAPCCGENDASARCTARHGIRCERSISQLGGRSSRFSDEVDPRVSRNTPCKSTVMHISISRTAKRNGGHDSGSTSGTSIMSSAAKPYIGHAVALRSLYKRSPGSAPGSQSKLFCDSRLHFIGLALIRSPSSE